MKMISKKIFRLIGLASIALVLTIGFSCNKDNISDPSDNPDGNDANATQPLIATADINFVDEGKTYDFKCYKEDNYGEIINYGDTLLMFRFRSTDKYGDENDGPTISIQIKSPTGFHQGDVFSAIDGQNIMPSIGTYFGDSNPVSAVVKITSLNGNHIKGVFNFKAKTLIEPFKEVIISNGEFKSDAVVLN